MKTLITAPLVPQSKKFTRIPTFAIALLFFALNPAAFAASATPSLFAISPSAVTAGSASIKVGVYGSNFNGRSSVLWNGSARRTTYYNSNLVVAVITSSDLATNKTASITVQDSRTGNISNAKSFTVLPGSLGGSPTPPEVLVAVSPATASLTTGATQQFIATLTGTVNTAITWTATGGTITSGGLFTAPASAGTYTVKATSVADATKSATSTVTVTAPAPAPAAAKPVAAYAFSEGSGLLAQDSSGNGATATFASSPLWTGGKFGTGVDLNGTNFATVTNIAALNLSNTGTVEAWVRLDSLNQWHGIIAKGDANLNSVHNYALEVDDQNRLMCILGSGGNTVFLSSSTQLAAGQLYHAACVWDGSNLQVLVNGVLDGSTPQTITPLANTAPLYIGQFGGNTDRLNGLVDEVRIYNRALSATEINNDKNTSLNGSTPVPAPVPASVLISVAVGPTSVPLLGGAAQQFTATVGGSTNTAVTWSTTGGTVSASGLYTAPVLAGTYTVKATSVADPTKSASASVTVTVPPPPVVSIAVSPTSLSLQTGAAQQFAVSVLGASDLSVTWSTTGGAISASGQYIAPSTAGSYQVRATSVADPSKSATALVTVTAPAPAPAPSVVAVQLSPSAASVVPQGPVQFTASVTGTSNTAVTWSATGGSISSSGAYTAPATPGTYVVKATSVADPTKSASSSITVVAVVLSWTPVSGDVASYRVYRTTQAGGPLTMLSSVSASQLTYSDVNLAPSQTYWYTVTTVSGGGAESSYANQVPASTP